MLTRTGPALRGRAPIVASLALGLVGLAGCGSEGRVTVENSGRSVVNVAFGEDDWGNVEPGGGAVVNTDDCLDGPIVVTFEGGGVVKLAEAACPGQRLVVRDETAELLAQRTE